MENAASNAARRCYGDPKGDAREQPRKPAAAPPAPCPSYASGKERGVSSAKTNSLPGPPLHRVAPGAGSGGRLPRPRRAPSRAAARVSAARVTDRAPDADGCSRMGDAHHTSRTASMASFVWAPLSFQGRNQRCPLSCPLPSFPDPQKPASQQLSTTGGHTLCTLPLGTTRRCARGPPAAPPRPQHAQSPGHPTAVTAASAPPRVEVLRAPGLPG